MSDLHPRALPRPNPFASDPTTSDSMIEKAYNTCLELEAKHEQVVKAFDVRLPTLICARFLGYMLLEAPTQGGRAELAWEIDRCASENCTELQELAQLYSDHLLRVFPRTMGPTRNSTPTTAQSHPSESAPPLDFHRDRVAKSSRSSSPPTTHADAKEQALIRDNHRCVVCRKVDITSKKKGLTTNQPNEFLTKTHLAHIFDRSTDLNEDLHDNSKSTYAASAHAILFRFGQISSLEELNGPGIHRLQNAMTIDAVMHELFADLTIWFERNGDDPPHHYRLAASDEGVIAGFSRNIVFTTPDEERLPLPDPRYLALHAACARVAHLSGAGEYIDEVLRDLETTGVLAPHGSSDVLYHALVRRTDIDAF
ncbi:hypothetical protein CVT26_000334 [Gymnopilus dilepis]|uniref:HNH nuclease domain-containing protein n=1 Tax=Gymnopilus dilepis TaxID=231916 RepID=A0A409VHI1_9AGAR|nr:hypothetical protein CVT26_000334 [Gymnopilus dilepis]